MDLFEPSQVSLVSIVPMEIEDDTLVLEDNGPESTMSNLPTDVVDSLSYQQAPDQADGKSIKRWKNF